MTIHEKFNELQRHLAAAGSLLHQIDEEARAIISEASRLKAAQEEVRESEARVKAAEEKHKKIQEDIHNLQVVFDALRARFA